MNFFWFLAGVVVTIAFIIALTDVAYFHNDKYGTLISRDKRVTPSILAQLLTKTAEEYREKDRE